MKDQLEFSKRSIGAIMFCNTGNRPMRKTAWGALCVMIGILSSGCYQTKSAPAIRYDDQDVEVLRQQIQAMDWGKSPIE